MNKQEFLKELKQKLSLINENEKDDILMEYGSYIDDKVSSGVSEEDAVAGFGDIDELSKDILDAYKINTDKMDDPVSSRADQTIDKVYQKAESTLNKLGNLSLNDIFHILFDAFILLVLIAFGKFVIVDILCQFILSISIGFLFNSYMIENFLLNIIKLVYFVIGAYFFVKIMIKRIDRYKNNLINVGVMDDVKSTWNSQINSDLPPIPKPLYHERKDVKKTDDVLVKFLLVLGIIPVSCVLIGAGIALVMMVFVSLSYQASSIGLYLMDISVGVGCAVLLMMLFRAWPGVDKNA